MKNFIQTGQMITVPAPVRGVASGQGVIVGGLFGIAATTAPEGSNVEIAITAAGNGAVRVRLDGVATAAA